MTPDPSQQPAADFPHVGWEALTRSPLKARLYTQEAHFREGLAATEACYGDRLTALLHRTALLIVKPEGLAAGKALPIMTFIHDHGFVPVGVTYRRLSRLQWREIWRYQLSAATLDRIAVNDLMLRDPVLILLLNDTHALHIPASVRLSALKGPSDIARQSATCLRRLLNQPNRLFSLLHVSDEPADLLRELAILFDPTTLRRLLPRLSAHTLAPASARRLQRILELATQSTRTFDLYGDRKSVV